MKTKNKNADQELDAQYSFRISAKMMEAVNTLWGARAPRMIRQLIARKLGGFNRNFPESSRRLEAVEPVRRAARHLAGCHAALASLADFVKALPKERAGILRHELSAFLDRIDRRLLEITRLLDLHLTGPKNGHASDAAGSSDPLHKSAVRAADSLGAIMPAPASK